MICLVVLIYNFTKANNSDVVKTKSQGGIENKFETLIDYTISLSQFMKIISKTDRTITIGYSLIDGSKSDFFITNYFGKVIIKWSFYSPHIGSFKADWDFPENYNQIAMINEIDLKIVNLTNQ